MNIKLFVFYHKDNNENQWNNEICIVFANKNHHS